jgi:hypothetical protein
MSEPQNKAVFLSYASQDAEAAPRICKALRAAGVDARIPYNFQWFPPKRTGFTARLNVLAQVANSRKSRTGRAAGLGAGAGFLRAADRNCLFSTSLSRAMDGFQLGQSGFEIEQSQVVFQQSPVERQLLVARRLEQKPDVIPVADRTRGVIDRGLNLQADDVFDGDDGQGQVGTRRQTFRPTQHAESGAAKRMQDIDAAPRAVGRHIVRHIIRVEFAPIATTGENPIRNREVLEHEDEIKVHRGALHATQGHGEAADQRVTHACRVELAAHRGNDLGKIHPKYSDQSPGESSAMATVVSGAGWQGSEETRL